MITHSFMTAIRTCSTSITVAVHGIDTLRYVLGEIIFTDDKHLKTRPATYRLINLCFVAPTKFDEYVLYTTFINF